MKWETIRVSEETKQALEVIRETWIAQADRMKFPLGSLEVRSNAESKNDVIGLDQVIRRLIINWREHHRRAEKSRKKRAAAAQAAAQAAAAQAAAQAAAE